MKNEHYSGSMHGVVFRTDIFLTLEIYHKLSKPALSSGGTDPNAAAVPKGTTVVLTNDTEKKSTEGEQCKC